jgi:hypothetical protein
MTDAISTEDRRTNPQLRVIFIEAYEVIYPFFDPINSWGGQTQEHLAYRTLHDLYPRLSNQDVFTLVTAARRVFHTTGKPAAP